MIVDANLKLKTYYSTVETKSLSKELIFNNIFIFFSIMLKSFVQDFRPLIGADGAVALDGNNEIFPQAYVVVNIKDKEKHTFFL